MHSPLSEVGIVIGINIQSYAVIRNVELSDTATLLRLSQIFDVTSTSLLESQAAYLVTNFPHNRKITSIIIYAQKGIRIVIVTANNLFHGINIENIEQIMQWEIRVGNWCDQTNTDNIGNKIATGSQGEGAPNQTNRNVNSEAINGKWFYNIQLIGNMQMSIYIRV